MRRYVAPSGVRAVAAWLGALALTALVIVPALRVVQWAWAAGNAAGLASGTTVSACRASGGRWVPNMCMFDHELDTARAPHGPRPVTAPAA